MRIIACLIVCLLNLSIVCAEEIKVSFAMDADPVLQAPPPTKIFAATYKPLWFQTLARPEADLQRMSAETIAQAHEYGFPEMAEAKPRLLEILSAKDSHPTARFAAARCLIVLDARDSSKALLTAAADHGADLRQLIEPALGKWKFEPLRDMWRARLMAADTRHRDLLLAIHGLAQVQDTGSVPQLLKLVHDSLRPAAVRLEAARSAGALLDSGLENDAAQLVADKDPSLANRLCAVSLLSRHGSEAGRAQLLKLAVDPEPTVIAPALKRLLEINPDLVLPLAEGAMRNADPIVRQRGSEAYLARPTVERLVFLVQLLDDPHPTVRGSVREGLYLHTKTPEFDAVLRPAFIALMAANGWRGQEQTILLLATLDHEASAPRFIELMDSPRDEVMITAAWGLRKLAITDTLPTLLKQAQKMCDERKNLIDRANAVDHQIVHLFEAMGQMRYMPADPLLRTHVPKNFEKGIYSRGAAIWALGYLYEDKPDEPLAKALGERAADVASIPPETIHVQMMSEVALGRMRATSQVPLLKGLLGTSRSPTPPNMATRWALIRITGEQIPELEPYKIAKGGWFLAPLDNAPPPPGK